MFPGLAGTMTIAVAIGLDHDGLGESAVCPGPEPADGPARGRGGHAVDVLGARSGQQRGHRLSLEYRPLLLVYRLVDLDELAVGQLPDDAGLVTALQLLPVSALQRYADTPRDQERDQIGRTSCRDRVDVLPASE